MRVGIRDRDEPERTGEKCPTGVHLAVLAAVYDVGLHAGFQGGPDNRKSMFVWETVEERDTKGRRFMLIDTVANYLGKPDKPSKMAERIEALRGSPLTEEEYRTIGVDTDEVVGRTCVLVVKGPTGSAKWPKVDSAVSAKPQERTAHKVEGKYPGEPDVPPYVKTMRAKAKKPGAAVTQREPGSDGAF